MGDAHDEEEAKTATAPHPPRPAGNQRQSCGAEAASRAREGETHRRAAGGGSEEQNWVVSEALAASVQEATGGLSEVGAGGGKESRTRGHRDQGGGSEGASVRGGGAGENGEERVQPGGRDDGRHGGCKALHLGGGGEGGGGGGEAEHPGAVTAASDRVGEARTGGNERMSGKGDCGLGEVSGQPAQVGGEEGQESPGAGERSGEEEQEGEGECVMVTMRSVVPPWGVVLANLKLLAQVGACTIHPLSSGARIHRTANCKPFGRVTIMQWNAQPWLQSPPPFAPLLVWQGCITTLQQPCIL